MHDRRERVARTVEYKERAPAPLSVRLSAVEPPGGIMGHEGLHLLMEGLGGLGAEGGGGGVTDVGVLVHCRADGYELGGD